MSKSVLVILFSFMAGRCYSQDYFVLIQSDNKQSFFVRFGERSISSTTDGSLILSQLKDSTYKFTVIFPGEIVPDQDFSVDLHHRDQQLLLKNEKGKGWILVNPSSGETYSAEAKLEKGTEFRPLGLKKDDAFSRLMAGVVKDTAVMYNTYALLPVVSDSPIKTVLFIQRDSALTRTMSGSDTVTNAYKSDFKPVVKDDAGIVSRTENPKTNAVPVLRKSVILKLSERKMPHSLRIAFADHSTGKKADTVIIYIMNDTPAVSKGRLGTIPTPTAGKNLAGALLINPKPGQPTDSSHRAGQRSGGPNPDSPNPSNGIPSSSAESLRNRPDSTQKHAPSKVSLPFVNSDCHDFATDYDVDKLKVRMLELSKDDDRIQAARKAFKVKCYSTRQIRALSELFVADALKFRFLQLAYPFASDENFRDLVNTLSDPVYSAKFKAMTGLP